MAFAAAKKVAAVFIPVVGALIELQESVGYMSIFYFKKKTYPTIPRPQCFDALQKNQIAVPKVNYDD